MLEAGKQNSPSRVEAADVPSGCTARDCTIVHNVSLSSSKLELFELNKLRSLPGCSCTVHDAALVESCVYMIGRYMCTVGTTCATC